MSNTAFEDKVLEKLEKIETDVSGLKTDVSGLHQKFDHLDDRIDETEWNLKQEMRVQSAYLNQAFDRMSFLQQNKADFTARK